MIKESKSSTRWFGSMLALMLMGALGFQLRSALESRAEGNPQDLADVTAVRPGWVSWHSDFDGALAASRVSGRPVLLFQLLGDLDRVHC